MNKSATASSPRPSHKSPVSARTRWLLAAAALASLSACVSNKGVVVRKNDAKPTPVLSGSDLLPASGVAFTLAPLDKVRVQVLSLSSPAGTPPLIAVNDTLEYALNLNGSEYKIIQGDAITVKFSADPKLELTLIVRPDGKITLGTLGEVMAAGKTSAELSAAIDDVYKTIMGKPGSSVTVTKVNLERVELAGKVAVEADGAISLPRIGRLPAAGKSTETLATKVAEEAKRLFGNDVSVSLIRTAAETGKSGLVGFDGSLVVTADGLLALPELGFIPVKGKTVTAVQNEIQATLKNLYPNPLTVVVALEASDARVVYIDGEVFRAGAYPLTPSMTLLKAIALAGGTKETGDLGAVVMIHRNAENDAFVYITNLKEVIKKGAKGNDLVLSPQDIVLVPRTSVAKANLWIEQYVTKMLPFSRSVSYSYNEGQTQIK